MTRKSKTTPDTRKRPRKPEPTPVQEFRAFLTAADAAAAELLITQGILGHDRTSADGLFLPTIRELAARFGTEYQTTNLDDVIHYEEAEAHCEAAFMIGLAMGLRLQGVNLATIGGAR